MKLLVQRASLWSWLVAVLATAGIGCTDVESRAVRMEALEGSDCCVENPDGEPLSFSGSFSGKGTVTSSAAKGQYKRGDATYTTSDRQLQVAKDHAKSYDGPTTYEVHYSITLKPDKTVDATKSSVTVKKATFTHSGTKSTTTWDTVSIPVTGVTLGACDVLEAFTFKGDAWYKDIPNGITDRGIVGSASVKTTVVDYTAKYQSKSNGAIYTYTSAGEAPAKECPEPEQKCCIPEDPFEDVTVCEVVLEELCQEPPPPPEPPAENCAPFDIYEPLPEDGGSWTDCSGGKGGLPPAPRFPGMWR